MKNRMNKIRFKSIGFIFIGAFCPLLQNYIGLILLFICVGIAIYLRYRYRCPYCDKLIDLRMSFPEHCPYCGKRFDD